MRILIAPDKFAGTLSAVEAAAAMAEGWRRQAPDDRLDLAPMSDGGPGFVEVLKDALGGRLVKVAARGPHGGEVECQILLAGGVAYVESAQACGLHLLSEGRSAEDASSYGVGQLIAAAVDEGALRVVVGLGGSGTNDGGAGMLAALGAYGDRVLDAGATGLGGITSVDLGVARARLHDAILIAATDVDNPLTGLFGATKTYGPQKGIADERLPAVDALLGSFAFAVDKKLSLQPGAGAAGGLGFAIMALGGERVPGIDFVARAVKLPTRARRADLVLTGEGAFDFSSRSGKVPYGVAQIAAETLRPCVALAGQVLVGAREMRALGIESAYSLVEAVGEERAFADAAGGLADLAARVARTWSR